jgi:hypothetical protein
MTVDVDDIFSPGGAAVALSHGCELAVHLGDAVTPSVYLSEADLTCPVCDRGIDTPNRRPLTFLAVNKILLGGLCRRCDPIVGPRPPNDFDPS